MIKESGKIMVSGTFEVVDIIINGLIVFGGTGVGGKEFSQHENFTQ
jgi:hypothetical protein